MRSVPSRTELLTALADPDRTNPLAAAIEAVIVVYGELLDEQARRAGAVPNPLVLPRPFTDIEAFALEMFAIEIGRMGVQVVIEQPN